MMVKKTEAEMSNLKSKISKPQSLRVLMVEDSEDDMLLEIRELKKGGYNPVYERVETAAAMKKALKEKKWDIILCDYKLPKFNAPSAIAVLKETNIDIPVIIVSGAIGEETAVECMRLGAHDYIMKNNLSRLCVAIARELDEANSRSKRKQAEEELRENEEKYRWMLDNMADVITVMDMNLRFTYVSPSIIRMRGYTAEEATAQTFEQVMTPESLKISAKVFEEEMRLEASGTADPDRIRIVEVEQYRKDGSIVLMENHLSFMRDEAKKPVGIISVSHDITDRKRTKEALLESEAQYRWLSEHITDGVWLIDMNLKPTYQSPSMEKLTGFTHEELMELPMEKRVTPESFKLAFELFLELLPRIMADSDYNPLRTLELECCCKDGTILWTENKFSGIRDENGKPVSILAEVRDITERKQAEEERKQSFERVRKALRATVQAISMTVEMKDPYTSGHQQRVADLARSIATEMGLSADRQDFIRTASSIHDIGKISLPAEILSKPTKLTDLEFKLIKTHSQSGYDILKDIEFPWPVADVVLQHHERMDGSGYPHGLKGENISLEARILAVADVVEAITSHRPYRPALGIDVALEEISRNRGIFYDADAVDACLKLFREKGYTLVR
jgi:PAS domain S-box-containing protein